MINSTTYSYLPNPTNTGSTPQCNNRYTIQSGNTCGTIETNYGITQAELVAWNSYIDITCNNLWVGYSVCVSSPITPSTFPWWNVTGCYSDSTSSRTLTNYMPITNQATIMTVELCQTTCFAAGYKFAGVGQDCFCDNEIANNGPASDGCNMTCPGNAAEICGGNLQIDVYTSNKWTSLGCYSDSASSRTLTQYMSSISNPASTMTIEICQNTFESAGYTFSGVEWVRECFCDNTIRGSPAPGGNAACNMACPGNSAEIYGGNLLISISSLPVFHAVGCYTDSTSARILSQYVLEMRA